MPENSDDFPWIFVNNVDNALGNLKNCDAYISAGMQSVTNTALDLVVTQTDIGDDYNMENLMSEYVEMDRDLNQYITAVETTLSQVKDKDYLNLTPDLKALVEEKLVALKSSNTEDNLRKDVRLVQFRKQLRDVKKQCGLPIDPTDDDSEQIDEDMIVTQSQTNFICPITQLEMKKPVKNKVCGHTYEEEAIRRIVESKHKRNKKACCPTVGCSHTDVKLTDLVQDVVLRKAIENHRRMAASQGKQSH
ncbi:E3 SUMO-protein ligase NSE2 [Trichosurus vulpecula]|uniref:E3 SUMO-protein ligase NSE2 n=1 Tax=Trichosurus vulpecula TaxID=9337 RepID=UPI00186AC5D8|nr:E3 SUMO-protein ligase NSE2 [Trichosurus vulpecula]XP_036590060.1 E3 SUMO-protein ligase NSE2 [Trichosurus vulpecula]